MREVAEQHRRDGKRVAFVPTMGAFHEGHRSLIRKACEVGDVVVTSIFVNPLQFTAGEDFERYPRNLEVDQQQAFEAGATIVFAPSTDDLYPRGFSTTVNPGQALTILEGKQRKGHFEGVATVVSKLFNIVKPHIAVFGQKDAQQAFIISKVVQDLNFDVKILVEPTIREDDGLAMSSRNIYLTKEERIRAAVLYKSLKEAERLISEGERSAASVCGKTKEVLLSASPTAIDYVACIDPTTFGEIDHIRPPSVLIALAVRFGATRLIDNMEIYVS